GFGHGPTRRLLTKLAPLRVGTTPREANLGLLRTLGIQDADPHLRAFCSPADQRAANALLERLIGEGPGPLVGIHPGSDWGCQMWGFEQWAEVADHLIERWNARLMITGLASERWMADRIASSM